MRQLYKRSNRSDQSIENLMVQHKIVLKSKIFIEQETLCDNAVRIGLLISMWLTTERYI